MTAMTLADRTSDDLLDSMLLSGSSTLGRASARLRTLKEDHIIWVVLVVALAVIAAMGIMVYAMTYCISHGRSYWGGLTVITKSWWNIQIGFYCS